MQPIFELSKLCLTHCTRLLRKLWRHLFVVLCECQTKVFKRLKKKKGNVSQFVHFNPSRGEISSVWRRRRTA